MNKDVRSQESSSPKRNRKERSKRPDQQLYVPKRRGQQQASSTTVEKVPSQTKVAKDPRAEISVQQVTKSADVTDASAAHTKQLVGKDVTSGGTESPVLGVSQLVMSEDAEALMPHMKTAQREKDVSDSHSKEDAPIHSTHGSIGSTRTSKQADAALMSDVRTEESPQGGSVVRPDVVPSKPISKSLHSNRTATDGGIVAVENNKKNEEKSITTSDTFKNEEFDQKIVTAESGDSADQINKRDTKSNDVNSISSNVDQSKKSKSDSIEPKTDPTSCNIDQNKSSVVGLEQEESKSGLMSNTEKVIKVRTLSESRNDMSPSMPEDSEKLGEAKRVTSSGVEDKKDKVEDKDEPDDQTSVGVSQADDEEEDEDSWDKMFDDTGESLLPDEVEDRLEEILIQEYPTCDTHTTGGTFGLLHGTCRLTKEIKKTKITVKKPKNDYDNYNPKDSFDYSAYEHVIELCDFPAEFKTQDLITTFSAFKSKGVDIKWVDETHALAIFATPMIAQDALSLSNPMLRTRHLSLATRQSKLKAKECVDSLQPFKPRPETSAVAARRLVSGALGIKTKVSREQRDQERQKIKQVKEKRREDRRQTEDIWEGKI